MALEHPERFEAFIGTGQLIDLYDNEVAMLNELRNRTQGNDEETKLVDELINDLTSAEGFGTRYFEIRNKLLNKYRLNVDIKRSDIGLTKAMLVNPYFTSKEMRDNAKYLRDWTNPQNNAYILLSTSSEIWAHFSLKDVTKFPIPYYNINGDQDYVADYRMAQEFFDRLEAPAKKMYILKGAAHGTLLEKTEDFSRCIHDIAEQ